MECAGNEDDGRLRHDVDWGGTAVGAVCERSENEGEEQRANGRGFHHVRIGHVCPERR